MNWKGRQRKGAVMSENEKNMTEQATEKEAKEVVSRNFIEQIIDKDLAEGV